MTDFIVYDLEYTTWDGARDRGWSGPGEYREIVQIGAVRVDAQYGEKACFEVLVKPRINPILSQYFIDLTGISQNDLDADGVDAVQALTMLLEFGAGGLDFVSNGADCKILAENCALLGIDNLFVGRTRDINGEFLRASGLSQAFSCDLPRIFGLGSTAGRSHTALADARNVAAALAFVRA